MPNLSQPSFDHEATLEELAGVGKNRRFDKLIDDEEFEDIQVREVNVFVMPIS